MYVAVKGGERAIANAHRLLADARRGDRSVPEISVAQIEAQLSLSVDRVMGEGSLYDRGLAALAIKQARGDLIEAIFLVRAYRTTLPRFGFSEPVATDHMSVRRRISATYKDLPGGQLLGPTFDYTHRLLDFALAAEGETEAPATAPFVSDAPMPRVTDIIGDDDLIEANPAVPEGTPVGDLTRDPLAFPAERDLRLQNLVRGDEGFLLALGYSTQRGYGRTHPFVGEIRFGEVERRVLMRTDWGFVHQDAAQGLRMGVSAGGNIGERLMAIGNRHYGNIRATALEWLARVEIDASRIDDRPTAFSGGMRQRLQIARNLVTEPRLIFMDEPTGGLDVSVQARLLDLMRGLVADLGLSVVLVTHDLSVARLLSHRILVMKDGKVIETGLTDRVLDDPQAPYTQLLVSSVLAA